MKSNIWFYLFWSLLILVIFFYYRIERASGNDTELIDRKSEIIIINPKKIIVEKGDTFRTEIQVVVFEKTQNKIQELIINGQKVMTNELGMIEYNEIARTTGIRRLNVALAPISISGGLTGEKFNATSSFEYLVIEKVE